MKSTAIFVTVWNSSGGTINLNVINQSFKIEVDLQRLLAIIIATNLQDKNM